MKEAVVHKGPKVQVIDSPIPKPGPGQVVTKVIYSGSNPKDWKVSGKLGLLCLRSTNSVLIGNAQRCSLIPHP